MGLSTHTHEPSAHTAPIPLGQSNEGPCVQVLERFYVLLLRKEMEKYINVGMVSYSVCYKWRSLSETPAQL